MHPLTPLLSITLLAAAAAPTLQAYERNPSGDADMRVALTVDLLPDTSDLTLSTSNDSQEYEDEDWDDAWRVGVDFTSQRLLSEEGGPYLAYGIGLYYNYYNVESDDSNAELTNEGYMLQPHVGIGMHATEWLFLSGNAYGEIGMATFDYSAENPLGDDIDEESDSEFSYGYGIYGQADFALGEKVVLGARVGWMAQELEGDLEDIDLTIESSTDGLFYGLTAGVRF
ncbi:MAG: hypothetical protein ACOCYV_01915 [Planctomycetota bacterium]